VAENRRLSKKNGPFSTKGQTEFYDLSEALSRPLQEGLHKRVVNALVFVSALYTKILIVPCSEVCSGLHFRCLVRNILAVHGSVGYFS
jgi:hypothetical protein